MLPEFLPTGFATKSARSIIDRLDFSLSQATAVRASVCYWTRWPNHLHRNFTELLKWDDSFCCVDIKDTTEVDALYAFSEEGASNFYVYLKEESEKRPGQLRLYHNLLHPKMLVLDMPNGQAEVWVGSHNFTERALHGHNYEASTVTVCTQDSAFYWHHRAYLEHIRNQCQQFNPNLRAAYKALQRPYQTGNTDNLYQILPLVGYNVLALPGQTLLLLGDDAQELRRFSGATPRLQRFLVRAGDLQTGQQHLLHAHVQSSGLIDKLDEQSFGIDFSARPYAIRRRDLIPYTAYRSKAFVGTELKRFAYWVNIKLGPLAGHGEELQAVKAPPLAWWAKDAAATAHLRQEIARERARQRMATGWEDQPRREWETERELLEAQQFQPEVRVARFRQESDVPVLVAGRDQEAAFTPRMLTAAQPFYEREFQQVYFEPEATERRPFRLKPEAQVPEELRAFTLKTLVQERRWQGG
ncbi:phospholipase D-like domain-containing protein [Hymenobacter pini]|uniref:hypothetical protein n=1 Tax=Hymenobacter pini TaxID=2880879 RepID=UPI001CF58191|nr:hypothetical protein [Hymenobacter pini]MCA8831905.1 hypothetical protein [Hymenobacter pini]